MIVKYSVMQQDTPKDYAALCEVNEDGFTVIKAYGADSLCCCSTTDRWI